MRMIPALSLLVVGLAPLVSAADDATFQDLRLQVGIVPGIKTVDSGSGSDTSASAKTSLGVTADYQYGVYVSGPIGWTAGAGLFYEQPKADLSTAGTSVSGSCTAYGVEINAGGIYKFTDTIHVELTPFFGIGADKLKANGVSGSGTFIKYGIDLGGYWTDPHGLQLGVYVGYEGFRGKGNANYTGQPGIPSFDVTAKGNGLDAGVLVGYRF